jgi:PST family polysaccharide transporter
MSRRRAFTEGDLERSIQHGHLGRVVRGGLGWAMVGHWGAFAIQVVTTVVLARLLTPEAYGLVGMALTMTIFADQFRSLGLSQAVVQRDKLTLDQINSLFFINAGVGFALAGAVSLSAPLIAAFYDRPELVGITVALSATYAINGLAVQAGALLTRRMQFRSLAVRDTLAKLLSSVVAIAAALAGAGYWALVLQQISGALFSLVVLWVAVSWRPGRPKDWWSALPLVKFGAGLTLANFINAFGRMGDSIIIGKALGAADLGIYQRALHLQQLPLGKLKQPLTSTMMTLLATLQREPDRYRALYTNAIAGISMVGMPLAVVMAVAAPEVIAVALGDQWTAAVPVFRWLCLVGFMLTFMSSTGWLFQSIGRAKAYVWWMAIANGVQIASYFVGLRWGVVGVAAAFALSEVAIAPLGIYMATRGNPVSPRDLLGALVRPLVVAGTVLAVSLPAWALASANLGDLLTLVVVGAVAGGTWAALIAAWPAARRQVLALAGARRKPTTAAPTQAEPTTDPVRSSG